MNCVLRDTVLADVLNKRMTVKKTYNMLYEMGMINKGQLAELAISKTAGVALCPTGTPNIDIVTGKQIKYAQAAKGTGSQQVRAFISRNTTAPILAVVYNPFTDTQYFFYIPQWAHDHLSGNCITISFGKDGTKDITAHWLWEFSVDSFEALCELAK